LYCIHSNRCGKYRLFSGIEAGRRGLRESSDMAKKVFTGERQNLVQLAQDVETWLRQQGFETQFGGGDDTFLVQARKQSTWRSLLGNNQSINVKIEGASENYSIDLDAGQWVKNLADSGGAGIVAALATMYTLGIAAAWSASERSKIETGLWAQKDASCPACFRIGAAVGTGEKFVRAEGVTLQPSGAYQGTKVFTDTFKCRFCSHIWDRGEKPRQVSLCPKCYDEREPGKTGEKVISCQKNGQQSQNGQPLAEQVFRETFQCASCPHSWEGGNKTRLVELCPHCEKVSAGVHQGDVVLERSTVLETRLFTDPQYRKDDIGCFWEATCPRCSKTVLWPECPNCGGAHFYRRFLGWGHHTFECLKCHRNYSTVDCAHCSCGVDGSASWKVTTDRCIKMVKFFQGEIWGKYVVFSEFSAAFAL